ncbi:hypothetical protein Psta_1301 [Pirellula staleyi DSM 6068]|uniref:Uncharacterized protein n=1 Tax=Pirellula staleyi (strain ATCC 27377 / DSM 6068 / ICPB 4128) TaxID=530564 RepID=D2QWA4_PIRSD|nr:hypothetical protein [Pirellula staleyi]ADB15979.1 hypothetical protein Psta_1301 [Pirellula staleyi DSM 6068]
MQYSTRSLFSVLSVLSVLFCCFHYYWTKQTQQPQVDGFFVSSQMADVDLLIDDELIASSDRPFELFVKNSELLRIAGPNAKLTTDNPGFWINRYGILCSRVVRPDASSPVIWFRNRAAIETTPIGFGNAMSIEGYTEARQDTKYGDRSRAVVWHASGKEKHSTIAAQLDKDLLSLECRGIPGGSRHVQYRCIVTVRYVRFDDFRQVLFEGDTEVIEGNCWLTLDISELLEKYPVSHGVVVAHVDMALKEKGSNKKIIELESPMVRVE